MTTLLVLFLLVSGAPPGTEHGVRPDQDARADTLTLDAAYRAAVRHFPRGREADIAGKIRDLRMRNLDTRFLPSVTIFSQATYNSDVAEINIPVPGVPSPSIAKDQYQAGLSVDQLIYDGGIVSAQRRIEQVRSELTAQEVNVAAYALRDQVETVWFAALMSEAEQEMLDVLSTDLEARRNQARAAVERGVGTSSNVDILSAGLLNVEAQRVASRSRRRAAIDVLAELTGWDVSETTTLIVPVQPGFAWTPNAEAPEAGTPGDRPSLDATAASGAPGAAEGRPEYAMFELSRARLDLQANLTSLKTRPRVSAFGNAAVGRPQGMNFFDNSIGPFFTVGVKLAWPLWDWHASAREREMLGLQGEAVTAQEDAFRQGIRARAATVRREIESLTRQLEVDAELVDLRRRIVEEARSRFDNGVITATDYLVERNEEHRARLSERLHRIQLARATAALHTILGSHP